MAGVLEEIYHRLYERFGPQHWWPGDSPFEVMVGAILTQNTAWRNVERAINNLKSMELLDPKGIVATPLEVLEDAVRPAGFYKQKARYLKAYCDYFVSRYGGDHKRMRKNPYLREELLQVRGIGEETADSILLYALDLPFFVIDAYTRRVLARHGIIQGDESYRTLQEMFHSKLKREVSLYNEYHALFVAVGKHYCRAKAPLCESCPLEGV